MIRTWITAEHISIADVMDSVGSGDDGAVVLFAGTVRRHHEGREVTGLRYDAYPEMAERVLREIAHDAADRFGATRLTAVHRTGELGIGEVSVVVAVSTPHRAQAFDTARFVIDEIKQRLPVWKKEHHARGSQWLDGTVPPVAEASRE